MAAVVLIVFVPMMLQADPPPVHASDTIYRRLDARTENNLVVLDLMDARNMSQLEKEPRYGQSYLHRLVALRMADPTQAKFEWDTQLDWMFEDPGTFAQLSMGTQPHYRTLFGEKYGEPRGERVAYTRYVTPRWNKVVVEPSVDPLDGLTAGTWRAAWVNSSRLTRELGEVLRFNATYGSLLEAPQEHAAFALAGQGREARTPSANLDWDLLYGVDPGGNYGATVLAQVLPQRFLLSVSCGSASLPAGTHVIVRTELGLTDLSPRSFGGWAPLGPVRSLADGGQEATWELLSEGGCPSTVEFYASLSPSAPAVTRIHAWLSNGAMSRSSAVLLLSGAAPDAARPVEILPSAPYALQEGASVHLGAVFVNGAEDVNITKFVIDVPPGYDFYWSDGQGGSFWDTTVAPVGVLPTVEDGRTCTDRQVNAHWAYVDDRLEWCGNLALEPFQAASFVVDVKVATAQRYQHNQPRQGTAFFNGQPGYWDQSVEFSNGFVAYPVDGPGAWQRAPALPRFRVPAATPLDADGGYPSVAAGGGALGENVGVYARTSRSPYGEMRLPGYPGASFDLATGLTGMSALEGAAMNASLTITPTVVRAGASVRVVADFSSVMRTLQQAGGVVDVTRTFELFSPASPAGEPFLRLVNPVDASPPSPIRHLTIGNLDGAGDHEVVALGADGFLYALSTATTSGEPALWRAPAARASADEAYRARAGDVTALSAGAEVASLSLGGDVRLFAGASGAALWKRDGELARAYDLAVDTRATGDGVVGRVYTLGRENGLAGRTLAIAHHPDTGAPMDSWIASATLGEGGFLAPFAGPALAGQRVVVALAGGSVDAYTPTGTLVWSASVASPVGGVLGVTAGEYDGNPANGDEIVVVNGERVTLFSSEGLRARDWAPPAGVTATAAAWDASVTGTAGPEIAWAGTDNQVRLLDMSQTAPLVWAREAPGVSEISTDPLPQAPHLQVDPGDCVHSDLGDSLQCVLQENEAVPAFPGSAPMPATRVTTIAIIASEAPAPPGARVVFGGTVDDANEVTSYVMAVEAINGVTATGWAPREIVGGASAQPTTIAGAPRASAPMAREPFTAVGTNDGSVYLFEWDAGAAWSPPAAPGSPIGIFAYDVALDPAALTGTYLARAVVSWTAGTIAQEARLLGAFDAVDAAGWGAKEPYTLALHLNTWQGEWDD